MLCECLEYLRDILSSLSWGFNVMRKLLFSGELDSFLVGHLTLFFQVSKVSNQVDDDRWTCVISDLSKPLVLDIFEAGTICYIKDKEDAIWSLIKVSGNWSEAFLSSCIPDLELNIGLLFDDHTEITKFDADCNSVLFFKCLSR